MDDKRTHTLVLMGFLVASLSFAQGLDPRTAAGQLAVCGGAAAWQAVGYLEFEVKISNADGTVQGPWYYWWSRRDGMLRMAGRWGNQGKLEAVLDIGSRTGGAWLDGKQLIGKRLGEATEWALQRFAEDILWLTFPLEWGASGVTVVPKPDVTEPNGTVYLATEVVTARGSWKVLLDRETGRVAKSILVGEGFGPLTVTWSEWKSIGGVMFAQRREIVETGEKVEVKVVRTLGQVPPDVF